MKKVKIVYVIIAISILFNLFAVRYILKEEVSITFGNYYLDRGRVEEINYNKINREISWISDEDMAVKLVKAYLGDWLNYSEESDPLITADVSFDEEKYEYLIQITIKQRAGIYADTVERYLVGIRKDYGIVTYYDS